MPCVALAITLGILAGLTGTGSGQTSVDMLSGAPAGLALAALLRWGPAVWPAVWLGAFAAAFPLQASPWLAAAMACGGTLGPLISAIVLRRLDLSLALDRRRDLGLFAVLGVALTASINSLNAASWLAAARALSPADWLLAWQQRWLADALGIAVLGMPLLTLSRASLRQAFAGGRWIETSLGSLLVGAGAWLSFRPGSTLEPNVLVFMPHLMLCWLAARRGVFVASCAALALVVTAVLATSAGEGPFAQRDGLQVLALWWTYLASACALPPLCAAAATEWTARGARWQMALEGAGVGVIDWDRRRQRVVYSSPLLSRLGYGAFEFGSTLDSLLSRMPAADARRLLAAMQQPEPSAANDTTLVYKAQRKDGRWLWFEGHVRVAERRPDGEPLRVISTAIDITERRAAEDRQHVSARLFEHLHDGLVLTDASYRVLDVNPAFTRITGFSRDEMLGTVPAVLRPVDFREPGAAQRVSMTTSVRRHGSWCGEIIDRRRNGEPCALHLTISAVPGLNAEVLHHVLILSDTTQSRLQREQLERQAHFDELTRLPNRARMAQRLREALKASERDGYLLVVCHLDLDNFKPLNEVHGHEAGDRLLVELAKRLKSSLHHSAEWSDEVGRLGGDEFLLLIRATTVEEARQDVDRLLRHVAQPYQLGFGTGSVAVTASLGATIYPVDKADAETLLRHAGHAMYGAKQAGRNGFLFFDAEHDRRTEERFEALSRVQAALDAQEFCLYYQPEVDLRRGTVLGVEALLRWRHPQHGVIPPAHFLPLIEHTGLSASVGDWVLQQGIEQLAQWQRMGLDLTVSINISARHLQEPLFAQRLAGLLGRHSTPVGQRLVIEVLETAALADIDRTCELMQECRKLGVRFALDDFGTGYSTFTYLKRLPLDMLKIDRSFVRNMLDDRQDLAIVEGVIGLAETFGCTLVAEGIESPKQAARLLELGCDVGQGNGIASAMPVADVYAWVRGYRSSIGDSRQWAETA